jgi:hypothetical protein
MPMAVDGDAAVLCQLGESDEEFKKVEGRFFEKLVGGRFKILKVRSWPILKFCALRL